MADDAAGDRILHLPTFGSDQRESQPKSSQSIKLDERMAGELIDVIVKVFPRLNARR